MGQQDTMYMDDARHNQAMIREREEGMREIESTMLEVNDIFRDLSTMVHDQGHQLGESLLMIVCLQSMAGMCCGPQML